MALHLVFPALRSMAPLSDDLIFILSRVCIFHPEEAASFPNLIYGRVGWIVVNRLLFYLYESMLRLLFN